MKIRPIAAALDSLFETSPDAVIVTNAGREVLDVNPSFVKLMGYSRDELIGRSVQDFYPDKASFDRIWTVRKDAADRFISKPYIQAYIRKDGQEIICESVGLPLRDEKGHVTGFMAIVRDVSHEQIHQRLTSEADRIYLDALESSRETAWRFNMETGEIEMAGPVAGSVFGASEGKISVRFEAWKDRMTADSRLACERLITDMLEDGEGRADLVFEALDGSEVFVTDTGRLIRRDAKGNPLIAAGLLTDVSQHKALEFRHAETGTYLSAALEAADLGAWRFDLVNNICRLSGPLVRHVKLKKPNAEFTGAYWCSLLHREDVGNVIRKTMEMAEGRTNEVNVAYRLQDKNGEWRWIRSIGGVTRHSDDGRGLVANGIIKDETETIRLHERLESERNRFETIFRKTPAMLHQMDANGIITDVSAYWLSQMGYTREEVIGRPSVDFLTEESRIYATHHAVPDFLSNGRARDIALQYRKKNGDVVDGLMNAFLETNNETGERVGYGVITDVTQLRKAYRDLERSNRELDRFATIASHDLQEPLRKITAFAAMLRSRYTEKMDADGIRCLEFLADAASRMQKLIDDLLEYSQLEIRPVKPERLSLRALTAEIETQLSARITQTGTRITLTGEDEIFADRFLLSQILQNLLSNAIKYRSLQAPDISVRMQTEQDGWSISVADNGIGFDPKFATQIFEPFRRLHPRDEYEGAGIGLAVVRQAVDRQNGRISVDTRPQKGSIFTVFLPHNTEQKKVA
ncbi:MAG: hypothetical protein COW29_00210 [Rhodobacterales bacterium CG15_BIG_FIL_POST_REV_8_21_14_020_59_13]|nr:MAG: hypothetical protein COW29_00210 [Rhodobacterales bacterium CG15_BIG_FIL_POST_REV_8_21_14_020_59_13]